MSKFYVIKCYFLVIIFATASITTQADEIEEKKAYALIGIPIGYALMNSYTTPVVGVFLIGKNLDLTENKIGNWEGGIHFLYIQSSGVPSHLSVYLGHGVAFKNRLSAGILGGYSYVRTAGSNFNNGANFGFRAGYEQYLFSNFFLTPHLEGFFSTLSEAPFTTVALIELSYRIDLPKPWNK